MCLLNDMVLLTSFIQKMHLRQAHNAQLGMHNSNQLSAASMAFAKPNCLLGMPHPYPVMARCSGYPMFSAGYVQSTLYATSRLLIALPLQLDE